MHLEPAARGGERERECVCVCELADFHELGPVCETLRPYNSAGQQDITPEEHLHPVIAETLGSKFKASLIHVDLQASRCRG